MPQLALIVGIIETDSNNAVKNLGTGLQAYVIANPKDPSGQTFVLAFGGAAVVAGTDKNGGNIYYDLGGVIGYNADENSNIANQIENLQSLVNILVFNPAKTRANMDPVLKSFAVNNVSNLGWLLHPGDSTTTTSAADLVSRFVALS